MAVQDSGEQYGAAWASPHAPERWGDRAGGRRDENMLARWAESVPVAIPRTNQDGADARAHGPTDTVLVSRYGEIRTVLEIAQFPDHVQRQIYEALSDQ